MINPIPPKDRFPQAFDGHHITSLRPVDVVRDVLDVSYIVSVYNRPWNLRCVLASLAVQSNPFFEVIVVDNSTDCGIIKENKATTESFDHRFRYTNPQMESCYHSSAWGASQARGRFLCFPSDDSYYVPVFQEHMIYMMDEHNLGWGFCGILYNPTYQPYPSQPKVGYIDKTQYLIRRELFDGFAAKDTDDCRSSDGRTIAALVRDNIPYMKHDGVFVVHN